MRPRSLIIGFLGRFALVYGALILPWPGFNDIYSRFFRTLGQTIFARGSERRIIEFKANSGPAQHAIDTQITLANRDQLDARGLGAARILGLDTRGVGWVPTALFLALVFATPLPWRRRASAFLWGLLAVHGYIFFSVAIYVWNNSDAVSGLSLLILTPFWKQIVDGLEETLVTQMGPSFAVPVFVWIFVTFRRQDYRTFAALVADRPCSPG